MTTPFERSAVESEAVLTLAVGGEIDWSNAAAALGVPEAVPYAGTVTLDLRAVTYFDSAALGGLFRLDAEVRKLGASLQVVIAAESPLPALFEISQVARVMPVAVD